MVILIPAYEPDDKLVRLIRSFMVERHPYAVVVVDDGSGSEYRAVFERVAELGCDVIGHSDNRGKGYALKAGFAHIARRYPAHDVVCADCDGQHTLPDILKVAAAISEHPNGIVLGSRQFVGDVPAKSRFGNTLTRYAFYAATRLRLQDTQTGLRAYPASLLDWMCSIEGDRFEYELNALLAARSAGVAMHEVPIETVYLNGNESSHFLPIRDSIRVYKPLILFSLSSMASFIIDFVSLLFIMAMSGNLAFSVVLARLISAMVNFSTNRHLVFGAERSRSSAIPRYAGLVVTILGCNAVLMTTLTGLGVGLVFAKLLTESGLFVVSYRLQKRVVFAASRKVG